MPTKIKLANITPVFKKGSQTCLSNYVPISLLSVFHKLIEKLLHNRLINFLENHKLKFYLTNNLDLDPNITLTISIVDKIQNSIEGREYTCELHLDFSKAFDTVNHKTFLMKLEHYGIRGIVNECRVQIVSKITDSKLSQ